MTQPDIDLYLALKAAVLHLDAAKLAYDKAQQAVKDAFEAIAAQARKP
jgi:hypothetical protein